MNGGSMFKRLILAVFLITSLIIPSHAATISSGGGVVLKDEGSSLGTITSANCIGSDVTCSVSGTDGTIAVAPTPSVQPNYYVINEIGLGVLNMSSPWQASGCKLPTTSGPCLLFDGADDYVTVNHYSQIDPTSAWTLESWINVSQNFVTLYDGAGDYVSLANENNFDVCEYNTACSGAAWIKTSSTDYRVVMSKVTGAAYQGWDVIILSSGLVRFDVNSATQAIGKRTTSWVNDNAWHHIAWSKSTGNTVSAIKIYIDGAQAATTDAYTGTLTTTTANATTPRIGIDTYDGTSGPWNGSIDNVAIFNTEISLSTVQSLCNWNGSACVYGGQIANNIAGLVSGYNFNEGSGTTAADVTGANSGTLTNATFTESTGYTFPYSIIEKFDNAASKGGYALRLTSNGYLQGIVVNATDTTTNICTGTSALTKNAWHHVMATFDSTADALKCYVDGAQVGTTTTVTYNPVASTVALKLGAKGDTATQNFFGKIDEVAIWGIALTTGTTPTIAQRYNAGTGAQLAGTETNLLAVWHLNDGTGLKASQSGLAGIGSDSRKCTTNDSDSVTGACLTIQGAISKLTGYVIDKNVTVNVGTGTYPETAILPQQFINGDFIFTLQGALATILTHSSCITTCSAADFIVTGGMTPAYVQDTGAAWTTNTYQYMILTLTGGTGYDSSDS